MSFLSAEWKKLAIANYEVAPDFFKKYLPYKTELDLWKETCYVSLVVSQAKCDELGRENFLSVFSKKSLHSFRYGIIF